MYKSFKELPVHFNPSLEQLKAYLRGEIDGEEVNSYLEQLSRSSEATTLDTSLQHTYPMLSDTSTIPTTVPSPTTTKAPTALSRYGYGVLSSYSNIAEYYASHKGVYSAGDVDVSCTAVPKSVRELYKHMYFFVDSYYRDTRKKESELDNALGNMMSHTCISPLSARSWWRMTQVSSNSSNSLHHFSDV